MKNIVVIVGGSGSGKTTVSDKLQEYGFNRLITTTTRPMRKGEINHVHYHFVTKEEFWKIPKIEHSEYVGNFYGLSKIEIETKLKKYDYLVIVMDRNGASAMKKAYGDIVTVVFLTISPEEMERRMRQRGDSEEKIQERLCQAYEEDEFTKPEIADVEIINLDINQTVHQILSLSKKEAI